MGRSKFKKRKIGDWEYLWHRLYHYRYEKGYKDIYGKTDAELKGKIKEEEKALESGTLNKKKLFGAAFTEWFNNVCIIDKRPGTIDRYNGTMNNYIKKSPLWSITLDRLDSMAIQLYYNDLIKKNKTPATVGNIHKLVSPFIRYLYNNGYTPRDFAKAVILPKLSVEEQLIKSQQSDVRPMTKEEQLKFVEHIKGHQFEALFALALDTGLRQGELLALLWKDINFNDAEIQVYKTYNRSKSLETGKYVNVVGPPKTPASVRKVQVPKRALKIMKEYKRQQAVELIAKGIVQDKDSLIFSNLAGQYLMRSVPSEHLKKQFKECGIPDKRFHDLRHTYATRLFELGEDPKVMQKLLGHSELKITLDTYTHVLESLKLKSVSLIDTLYGVN